MRAPSFYISLAMIGSYGAILPLVGAAQSSPAAVLCWWTAGLVGFSLVEYLIHRFVFHLVPRGERSERFQYLMHGNHHQDPARATPVMIRPSYALISIGLISATFYLVLRVRMLDFAPGFMTGYGLYLFTHHAVHAYRRPRSFLRALWRNHALHHYGCDATNFGVSSPLWDIVFSTRFAAQPRELPRRRGGCDTE
jgi:sterol desaturase/sphingolipid hydroxylase (fatty acid hydroxylase superfamily)